MSDTSHKIEILKQKLREKGVKFTISTSANHKFTLETKSMTKDSLTDKMLQQELKQLLMRG